MTKEQQFDRMNDQRMALVAKKYNGGGLTASEQNRLDILHSKIIDLAADVSDHIMRVSASTDKTRLVITPPERWVK